MDVEQLLGRFTRLRADLIAAYAATTCQIGLIERLTAELAETKRLLGHVDGDEQGGAEHLPGWQPSDFSYVD